MRGTEILKLLSVIICLVFSTGCATQPLMKKISHKTFIKTTSSKVKDIIPASPDKGYSIGEYYEYRFYWLRIPVGYVTFEITGEERVKGRAAYVVKVVVKTTTFISRLFSIDDMYTSWVDKEKLIPLRYDVDRKEGTYTKKAATYFDHERGLAYFENFLDGSKRTYNIPDNVQDPVSSILKMRTLEMTVGKRHTLRVTSGEQIYSIHAHIEKREFLHLKGLGDYAAFFLSPYAMLDKNRVKKGTISGYISCDTDRIVLYVEARAPLFTKLTATLFSATKAGASADDGPYRGVTPVRNAALGIFRRFQQPSVSREGT